MPFQMLINANGGGGVIFIKSVFSSGFVVFFDYGLSLRSRL